MTLPAQSKISRRAFLAAAGASSAAWLLSACGVRPTPTPAVATPSPGATLLLTPTLSPEAYPIPTATATPTAPVAPPPTLTAIPTVSGTRPSSAGDVIILLPIVSEVRPDFGPRVSPPPETPEAVAAQPTASAVPLPTVPPATAAPMPTAPPTAPPPPSATATPDVALPPTLTPTPSPTPIPCLIPAAPPPESGPPYVGLHASADPHISTDERCMFLELRPSVVKVLTFHPPRDVQLLSISQPYPRWIVRAFLEFGGRAITPAQFVEFTLSDTQRTVGVLAGREVLVELHNEPNLVAEGVGLAWADGTGFADWWLAVLAEFRAALPGVRFIYPGLSPGGDVPGVRQSHLTFLEQSRAAVEAADALGMHVYWTGGSPAPALAVLDEVIARFPGKPIWITEASYNTGGISDEERAGQYLAFIQQLKNRPTVQGVTFFVASASNPVFEPEIWLGRSLARTLGNR